MLVYDNTMFWAQSSKLTKCSIAQEWVIDLEKVEHACRVNE